MQTRKRHAKAINRFREYARKVSLNHARTVWVLKCDIKKFFANINHATLEAIVRRYIGDEDAVWLVTNVIGSFHTNDRPGVGLPLGNLTSQLLVNIYMNEFDHFVKRELNIAYYIRYADDFVILHENKTYLKIILPKIDRFLEEQLQLSLHPNKVSIRTIASGIDLLGWVHFPPPPRSTHFHKTEDAQKHTTESHRSINRVLFRNAWARRYS